MICLMLATLTAMVLQHDNQDVVTLQHATPYMFTLGPDDPVLEGLGPSKTFRYAIEADDAVLFVYAESEYLDLLLRAEIEGGPKVGGAAALFAGRSSQTVLEDDDSGGLTTPFLRILHRRGGIVKLHVVAKRTTTEAPIIVHCFEAQETSATHAAAGSVDATSEAERLRAAGQPAAARDLLAKEARSLASTEGSERSEAIASKLSELGVELCRQGGFPNSSFALKRALRFDSRTLPDEHEILQVTRIRLALALSLQGNLEGARALQEKVLEIQSETLPDEHLDLQKTRGNLANILGRQGDFEGARALEEKVLDVFSKTLPEEHPDLQSARQNLASTLRFQGDLESSRVLGEKVLAISSKTLPEEHLDLQAARLSLAESLSGLGDFRGACALQERALAVYSKTLSDDHLHLQLARSRLASSRFSLGDLPAARELREKVLASLSKTLPDEDIRLQTARLGLARILRFQGDLEGARALGENVLASFSKTLPEEHIYLRWARKDLAMTLVRMNEPERSRALAREMAQQASRSVQQFHVFSVRELEARAISETSAADTALSIAGGIGVFPSDPEGDRLCFSMTEALRLTFLQARRLSRVGSRTPGTEELRKDLIRMNREISRLAEGGVDLDAFSKAVRERDHLERELTARLEESSDTGCRPDLDPASVAAGLGQSEAAIGYWRYRRGSLDSETLTVHSVESYLAWVLRPGEELRRIELGPAAAIEEAIEEAIGTWRNAIGAPTQRGLTREEGGSSGDGGAAVRELVIDPLREAIGDATTLVVAPADAMNVLPFEALPEVQGLLGDRFAIRYRLALSELTVKAPGELAEPSLLALGGIDYKRRDSASDDTSRSPASGSAGASLTALRGNASGPAFSWSFDKLAETRGEALAVSEYFLDAFEESGAEVPTVLTRKKATRDAFEELAPKHRYLHLATHGWFAPESVSSVADARPIDERSGLGTFSSLRDQVRGLAPSILCGLAFAGANGDADQYGRVRGVMTADEIGAMELSGVDLCVLSACETNVGLRRSGQGIASLQAALHAAGVRTAITSLWKVPDEATRELMDEFYRRLWVLGEPKAQALWNAKQKLRRQLDEDDQPVYTIRDWAGWVLSGDPE